MPMVTFAPSHDPHPPRCAVLNAIGAVALAGVLVGAAAVRKADAVPEPAATETQRQTQPPAATNAPEATKSAEKVSLRVPAGDQRGPDVTLIAGEERTVYEYRQHGRLHMIKVVPKLGRPYYLAPRDPTQGFGDLEQADSLIAQWVLREF